MDQFGFCKSWPSEWQNLLSLFVPHIIYTAVFKPVCFNILLINLSSLGPGLSHRAKAFSNILMLSMIWSAYVRACGILIPSPSRTHEDPRSQQKQAPGSR